jgi:succinoglycan biosynthesis protein ExoV
MKPFIYRGASTNFGDELNLYLWQELGLSRYFSERPGLLFGIGTLLKEPLPEERPLIVFGSGVGYGEIPKMDGVEVMFVRGPHSSGLLGGVPWITDPGILVQTLPLTKTISCEPNVIFIPHWTTIEADIDLPHKMREAGIKLVDPRWPVRKILDEILCASKVLTEALHGAVVADAFRTPWVPVYAQHGHLFKWLDWCESIGRQYQPSFVEIQSMAEIAQKPGILSHPFANQSLLNRTVEQLEILRQRLRS